jgi:hypothetical protein
MDLKCRGVNAGVDAPDPSGKTVRKAQDLSSTVRSRKAARRCLASFFVRANSLDEACALAGESPHAEIGGAIEVRMLGSFPKP